MNTKDFMKKIKTLLKKYPYHGIVILIILVLLFAGALDRGDSGALITLNISHAGTQIILDEALFTTTVDDNQEVIINTSPSTHRIITTRRGSHPWTKEVKFARGDNDPLTPFNLSTQIQEDGVINSPDEQKKVEESHRTYTVPLEESPIVSHDEEVRVFVRDDTNIIAQPTGEPSGIFCTTNQGCVEGIEVAKRDSAIEHLFFLPGFNNVVIFTDEIGTFALEITRVDTPNAQPLTLGGESDLFIHRGELYSFRDDTYRVLVFR